MNHLNIWVQELTTDEVELAFDTISNSKNPKFLDAIRLEGLSEGRSEVLSERLSETTALPAAEEMPLVSVGPSGIGGPYQCEQFS